MQIRSKRSTTTSSPTTTVDGSREIRVRAFRVGFIGAIGVLFALVLGGVVGQLSSLLVYVGMALFVALGLDPAVSWLQRRGLKRWGALVIVVGPSLPRLCRSSWNRRPTSLRTFQPSCGTFNTVILSRGSIPSHPRRMLFQTRSRRLVTGSPLRRISPILAAVSYLLV